ncbi:sulfite exporter TauE/SafE family protein [Actinokineospora xionganensis]|uniref:Probable membrane transporter protein n=1 Tax=Actinokineospora xionganensis TaxID=2684470 RepID=A0ABR7L2T3_9PSEU|nr:sulfite exporter TauE/SafE family protein [Actinokineospora xionganensis]MBC6446892.1 sulfite exporter TauE/SafE family protein [Actinokineospora xionganensis]
MTVWEAIAVVLAGVFAGGINTVVGSGTLITFPVLLAVGFPPVVANVSNTLGLVPGSITGAIGYRRELAGQLPRLLRLGAASFVGGVVGAVLLLVLPPGAFETIVPILIGLALVLVILQPWLARKLTERQGERHVHGGLALIAGVFASGIYGGYFGAAQGVLLLALMGILMDESLQRINAVKNVLAAIVNLVAGIVFIFVADVAWDAVALVAVGAIVGGLIGAKIGRKLSPTVLRAVIVLVGLAAIFQLLTR